jgi:amino acid transporter
MEGAMGETPRVTGSKDTAKRVAQDIDPQAEHGKFHRALGLFPATAVNMSQMVGIGPFITIPLILTAVGGPQAILGWIVGALIAMADGLVWSELGSEMPAAGGSYVYLREGFQYWTGRLMPFLFIWSTMLATPLIMSTGMIGMAQYLKYFWTGMTPLEAQLAAVGFTIITVGLLYRRIESIAAITRALWICMIITVGLVIIAGFRHFNATVAFNFPAGAFTLTPRFFAGMGAGLLIAIYDFLGYYTVAYLGDEVDRPGYVMPRSIILSIMGVGIIYLTMNVLIIGVVPWKVAAKSTNIGTVFMQHAWGRPGAVIITVLIIFTAFASVYTGLLGASRLPYNAAKDGLFFKPFAHLHPRLDFPEVSLLAMGVVTAIACFFSLSTIISALIAVSVVVQFLGQIGALTILRAKQPELKRPYKQWLYPIPSIIAFAGWTYIFFSSGWSAIRLAIVWMALGVVAFLIWAYAEKVWPFGPLQIREVFVERQHEEEVQAARQAG